MPILSSEIVYNFSGGASNSNPAASLGGVKSSVAVGSTLFDNVSSAEAAAGDVEYRCLYVTNTNTTLPLENAVVWIQTNTVSAQTTIDIGLGTSAINATEQTVADESTAPTGVTFSAAANLGSALSIGNIPAGQHKAVWVRRTVSAGAAASNDSCTLRVEGDTAA